MKKRLNFVESRLRIKHKSEKSDKKENTAKPVLIPTPSFNDYDTEFIKSDKDIEAKQCFKLSKKMQELK